MQKHTGAIVLCWRQRIQSPAARTSTTDLSRLPLRLSHEG